MINGMFDGCVWILQALARACGMSYQAVNVWIFVVVWPILTLFLVVLVLRQRTTIKRLKAMAAGQGRSMP